MIVFKIFVTSVMLIAGVILDTIHDNKKSENQQMQQTINDDNSQP